MLGGKLKKNDRDITLLALRAQDLIVFWFFGTVAPIQANVSGSER